MANPSYSGSRQSAEAGCGIVLLAFFALVLIALVLAICIGLGVIKL